MKKLFLLLPLLLLGLTSYSQSLYKGGLEVGANMMGGNLMISNVEADTEYSWGIRLGYVGEYKLSDGAFLRGAVLLNQRGFQFADERWGLNAIDVPVNLGYNFNLNDDGLKLFLDAGVNLEYNFRAFTKINDELVTLTIGSEEGDIKRFSTGVNFGTGLQFSEKVKLRVNYYKGMTNLLQSNNDEWNNHVVGVSLDYFFKA
ncbi:porin family protein [Limibacter armeniacum]|uniref:porin family protein n=1 Tax=Limibacter armeniacum TaxID=466084 RepID=UPI002FE6BEDD